MMNRTIRPLASTDIAALQAIDELQHGQVWSQRMFQAEIDDPQRIHLVAERAGDIVGHAAAWIDGSSCRVTNVAVAQEHSGHGHGSALLLSLTRAVLEGHRVSNMQLEVRPTNRRAQRLYGRFGFMPVGVEREFYDRSDDRGSRDAVVMAVPDVCAEPWRTRLDKIETDSADMTNETGAVA